MERFGVCFCYGLDKFKEVFISFWFFFFEINILYVVLEYFYLGSVRGYGSF